MHAGICDLWSEEALAAIDDAARDLLATAGVKVPSPAVRELLLGAGCTEGAGGRIRMPRRPSPRRSPPARAPSRRRRATRPTTSASTPIPDPSTCTTPAGRPSSPDPRTR